MAILVVWHGKVGGVAWISHGYGMVKWELCHWLGHGCGMDKLVVWHG